MKLHWISPNVCAFAHWIHYFHQTMRKGDLEYQMIADMDNALQDSRTDLAAYDQMLTETKPEVELLGQRINDEMNNMAMINQISKRFSGK